VYYSSLVCVCSLEDEIRQSAREMGFLLGKISSSSSSSSVQSGQSQQRAAVQQQADVTLQPLMDFLDGRSSTPSPLMHLTILLIPPMLHLLHIFILLYDIVLHCIELRT